MFSITLEGDRQAIARLQAIPASVRQALSQSLAGLAQSLKAYVVTQKLSGQVLNARSGALAASIASELTANGSTVSARVYSQGVPYATIQEFGGETSAHVIEARKAKVLAFAAGGGTVFARRVDHPGSKIPERSYLRSSLSDQAQEIAAAMKQAVLDGLRSAG